MALEKLDDVTAVMRGGASRKKPPQVFPEAELASELRAQSGFSDYFFSLAEGELACAAGITSPSGSDDVLSSRCVAR